MHFEEVALIFGATGGIGKELAEQLIKKNKKVIAIARNEEKLIELNQALGTPYYVCNATDEQAVKKTIDDIYKEYGRIDCVANCLGSFFIKPLEKTSLKEFQEVLNINLLSSFIILKEAVEKMAHQKKGSIVLFSSCAAKIGLVHHEAISAAKGAVASLVKSAAASYAPKGIRINALSPGLIDTNLSKPITSSENALKTSVAFHPLGRIGKPQEVASIAAFLLSDESGFITAQNISIDGGLAHIKSITH
jgi:NAD(P)-dependent dehydrogenase (short-subunit alcohol dehydrogenase family)